MKVFSLVIFLSFLLCSFSLKVPSLRTLKNDNKTNKNDVSKHNYYETNISIKKGNSTLYLTGFCNLQPEHINKNFSESLIFEIKTNITNSFLPFNRYDNNIYEIPNELLDSNIIYFLLPLKNVIVLKIKTMKNEVYDIMIELKYKNTERVYVMSQTQNIIERINEKRNKQTALPENNKLNNTNKHLGRTLERKETYKPVKHKIHSFNSTHISKANSSLSSMTTGALVAYNISIIIANFLYYYVLLVVSVLYFIILKFFGNKCTEYFIKNGYSRNQKNYSRFILVIIEVLLLNIVLSFYCYSDILIVLIFSINSLMIAGGIFFSGGFGGLIGALGFGFFGFLIAFPLLPIKSLSGCIWISIAIGIISALIGFLIGNIEIFTFEVAPNKKIIKRPVVKMIE